MSSEESHWLAAAFGGAEVGLAILDPDARLILWNDWLVDRSGIPFDRARDRIFGVFKRLHGPSKYEGTGIGLSICRKIVEPHGGTIELESELGQGTTFLFTLPGAPQDGKPDFA